MTYFHLKPNFIWVVTTFNCYQQSDVSVGSSLPPPPPSYLNHQQNHQQNQNHANHNYVKNDVPNNIMHHQHQPNQKPIIKHTTSYQHDINSSINRANVIVLFFIDFICYLTVHWIRDISVHSTSRYLKVFALKLIETNQLFTPSSVNNLQHPVATSYTEQGKRYVCSLYAVLWCRIYQSISWKLLSVLWDCE